MFDETFMRLALIVGIFTAGLCAYLGNFILMRRMTFISIALSEIAALGVALGLFLNISLNITAFLATFIGILFFWQRSKKMTVPHESMIGLIYAVSAALGIILVSKNPLMEAIGVDLISGNLLYCTMVDVVNIVVILVIIMVLHMVYFNKFLFISFDRETATAQGLKTDFYDLLLMGTIGLCISFCLKLTGVLFVFASMIIPGLIALNLFKKVSFIFLGAVLISSVGVFLGIVISYQFDFPASPSIICIYGIIYLLSCLSKKLFYGA